MDRMRSDDGSSMGRVTVSAGTALAQIGKTSTALIERADTALYAAKRWGRDRVLPAT